MKAICRNPCYLELFEYFWSICCSAHPEAMQDLLEYIDDIWLGVLKGAGSLGCKIIISSFVFDKAATLVFLGVQLIQNSGYICQLQVQHLWWKVKVLQGSQVT